MFFFAETERRIRANNREYNLQFNYAVSLQNFKVGNIFHTLRKATGENLLNKLFETRDRLDTRQKSP